MGPSCRRRTRSTRKPRKAPYKKQLHKLKNEDTSVVLPSGSPAKSSNSSLKIDHVDSESIDTPNGACSTPKGERYKIPEITTCPPAPKRRRIDRSCLLQRSPNAFYAPPDIELFFYIALGDISV